MGLRNTATRWGLGAQVLHWLVSPLVITQFILAWVALNLPKGPMVGTLFAWHKSIGATILALAVIRLVWRLSDTPPPLPTAMPKWEQVAARITHYLLYILIFAQPLAGLLLTLAGKRPLVLYGGWTVPNPIGPNPALHHAGEVAHFWLGYALLAVAVLHVAAALRHHFWRRDEVLLRMVPGPAAERAQFSRHVAQG
jgi:cytochrome b561